MTYMTTQKHKYPCPGGHKIQFVQTFLGHQYNIQRVNDLYSEIMKIIFFLKKSILHILPKIYLSLGWEENYNLFSPYPTHATYQIQLRLVYGRRTMTDANLQLTFIFVTNNGLVYGNKRKLHLTYARNHNFQKLLIRNSKLSNLP